MPYGVFVNSRGTGAAETSCGEDAQAQARRNRLRRRTRVWARTGNSITSESWEPFSK